MIKSNRITRREFLRLSALGASATFLAACAPTPPARVDQRAPLALPLPTPPSSPTPRPTHTPPPTRLGALKILSAGYPRAYFFRIAGSFAANERVDYAQWERAFNRLLGIEGKALDEEVPGRGFLIVCVEPGKNLVAVAAQKLKEYRVVSRIRDAPGDRATTRVGGNQAQLCDADGKYRDDQKSGGGEFGHFDYVQVRDSARDRNAATARFANCQVAAPSSKCIWSGTKTAACPKRRKRSWIFLPKVLRSSNSHKSIGIFEKDLRGFFTHASPFGDRARVYFFAPKYAAKYCCVLDD
ncbi:MAG: hypothetical protein L0Y55_00250 [Anaerolineales bacterium]|nr:hypothetical protein [Anaerolineales bacterium]